MNLRELAKRASALEKTICFPEAGFSARIVEGAKRVVSQGVANVVLIGDRQKIDISGVKGKKSILVVNPIEFTGLDKIVDIIYQKRKHKGLTREQAKELALDPIYFANAYCLLGLADGVVCGAEVSTASTLRPALQLIKGKEGLVSSYFIFVGKNRVTSDCFLMGDCAVIENPTEVEEAKIAQMMLNEYQNLGLKKPCCAFLSYSTMGSADSVSVQKVRKAYQIFSENNPRVPCIGETQFDACVNSEISKNKMPDFPFVRPANIFVMPNLDAGNIAYKITQYFGGLKAIGPITMGLNLPVNDLSRGCSVDDIVDVTAVTVLQCK